MLETAATALMTDENGKVVGVEAKWADGARVGVFGLRVGEKPLRSEHQHAERHRDAGSCQPQKLRRSA